MTSNPGRRAGLLYLAMAVTGAFSILYVPGKLIVEGDAPATVRNIMAFETLYRLSIVSGLTSAVLFLFLGRALYRLLHGVSEPHASLMVILVNISVAIGFALTMFDIAVLAALRGGDILAAFDEAQRDALAMLFLRIGRQGVLVAQIFWGLWLFPFGILVIRSGFLPRTLGVLLIINGVALLAASLTGLLMPAFEDLISPILLVPELGEIWMMLWLLIRGAGTRPRVPAVSLP